MKKIKTFEDLPIWQKSIDLAVKIYEISTLNEKLRKDFGLKDQIQRASVSISSNIAEGYEYDSNKAFIKFLCYAKGSAGELRSQLLILQKIQVIDSQTYMSLYDDLFRLSRQIAGFMKYLKDFDTKNQAEI